MKKIRYALEAALLFSAMGVARRLSLARASHTGAHIARFIGPKLGNNKRAQQNFAMCCPDIPAAERRTIIDNMWENIGRTLFEFPHLDKFSSAVNKGLLEVEGEDIIHHAIAKNKGAFFISG